MNSNYGWFLALYGGTITDSCTENIFVRLFECFVDNYDAHGFLCLIDSFMIFSFFLANSYNMAFIFSCLSI